MVTPGLYLVATPIGNRGDISLRALSVLGNVDIIYCEDTRESRKILATYGVDKPLACYHDHNAAQVRPQIIEHLQQGKRIALISDAGTPLISDPGYKLVQACYDHQLSVTTIPGACAVIAGLQLSGMPTNRFMFCGFVDAKQFHEFVTIPASLVFFESPKRVLTTLTAMATVFKARQVAVVRELTKMFEEVVRGDFNAVMAHFEQHLARGEIVIVLSPPQSLSLETEDDWRAIDTRLAGLLAQYSLKDAATLVATEFGLNRKQVYQRALKLSKNS